MKLTLALLTAACLTAACLTACGTAPGVPLAPSRIASDNTVQAGKSLKAIQKAVNAKLLLIAKDAYRTITVLSIDVTPTNTPGAYTFTAQITTKGGGQGEQSGTFDAKTGIMNILIDTTLTPAPIPSSFR